MSDQPVFTVGQIVKVRCPEGMMALKVTKIYQNPSATYLDQIITYRMRKDKQPRSRYEDKYDYNLYSNPLQPLDETDELVWRQGNWYVVTKGVQP